MATTSSRPPAASVLAVDPPASDSQALAEALQALNEAQSELEILRNSAGSQVGRHIVEMARLLPHPVQLLTKLPQFARTAIEVANCARIDAALFTGMPAQKRPVVELSGHKQARMAIRLAKVTANFTPEADTEKALEVIARAAASDWLGARARTALELARYARQGFPLPQPAPRSAAQSRRVLYLLRSDPAATTNGYTRRTHEIVRGLSALGWTVDPLVAPSQTRSELTVAYDSAHYRRLAMSSQYGDGLAGYITEYADAVVRYAEKTRPAVIHAASNFINGLAGASAARRLGIPFVYEVRGLWELTRLTIRPEAKTSLGFRAQMRLEADSAIAADKVLVLSPELGRELERRGLPSGRTVLAMSGAPPAPNFSAAERAATRQVFGLPADAIVIGYVGSLVSYEGLANVIAAFDLAYRRDQNVHLLIVGDGVERSSLTAAAQKLNAHRAIHFAGRVSPELARNAYSAIDIAIYARIKTEVTDVVPPLKHLEAAAAGVAIIVSDVAPLKSFAQSTRAARTVPAGDTHALADAIADLAADRSQRQALGQAGRKFATEMTWQKTAETISATYDGLVSSDHS